MEGRHRAAVHLAEPGVQRQRAVPPGAARCVCVHPGMADARPCGRGSSAPDPRTRRHAAVTISGDEPSGTRRQQGAEVRGTNRPRVLAGRGVDRSVLVCEFGWAPRRDAGARGAGHRCCPDRGEGIVARFHGHDAGRLSSGRNLLRLGDAPCRGRRLHTTPARPGGPSTNALRTGVGRPSRRGGAADGPRGAEPACPAGVADVAECPGGSPCRPPPPLIPTSPFVVPPCLRAAGTRNAHGCPQDRQVRS